MTEFVENFNYGYGVERKLLGNLTNSSLYSAWYYNSSLSDDTRNWYNWICSEYPHFDEKWGRDQCGTRGWQRQLQTNPWKVGNAEVKYCLSEKVESHCELKVALNLLNVVVAFNAAKFIIIVILTASSLVNNEPLVTIGDAAASFIEDPDPKTKGICLISSKDIKTLKKSPSEFSSVYKPKDRRLGSTISRTRWVVATAM